MTSRRKVVLVQLPIPPAGPTAIHGNVPLAAGYLKMLARSRGLEECYDIEIFPTPLANALSDQGLVEAVLCHEPWMVGFTCYLWNIDRTIWICQRLKERCPKLRIVLGGPEITADNGWVLDLPFIDYAAIGEGEQTFAELLSSLRDQDEPTRVIAGLWRRLDPQTPLFRQPLPHLNDISSPYLAGILDAADEKLLLLETIRGCIFKCKFCYYPKSYDALYFVSREKIVANLKHAAERGADEVVLLDPTLNQRRDFDEFLKLLADCNPTNSHGSGKQFRYFGELRAEGITSTTANLLREANFTEVEIGLQSVDPLAQDLMDRRNNMKAFERGVKAMLDAGIRVKVDLIIGLPGDTEASVRRGYDYLSGTGLFTDVQVFNLAILPGTAFRAEAEQLGLKFQPRPPYYVLETPTLSLDQIYGLMQEAQDVFDTDFDPFPPVRLEFEGTSAGSIPVSYIDLDLGISNVTTRHSIDMTEERTRLFRSATDPAALPLAHQRTHAFTLWFRSEFWNGDARRAAIGLIGQILSDNPHSTLQIVLEPTGDPRRLTPGMLQPLLSECYRTANYLDRYYGLNPEGLLGSKRLVVLLDEIRGANLDEAWLDEIEEFATVVWNGDETTNDDASARQLSTL